MWAQLRKRETASCPPFPAGKSHGTWSQLGVNSGLLAYICMCIIMRWVSQTFHSSLPCILPIFTLFFAPVPHSPFLLSLFPFSNSALSTFTQCVSAYICVQVCACMSVYMCACMCIYVCICTCVFCMCVREYLYVCVCESFFPSPSVCVCVFVYGCVWGMQISHMRGNVTSVFLGLLHFT